MTAGLPLSSSIPSLARAPRRRGLWAVPLGLSLLFVLGVVIWAQRNAHEEREELRRSLISDALSVEAQLRTRLDLEQALLRTLAAQLATAPRSTASLQASPYVSAGFRRLWIGLTWLDARNRIVAHLDNPDMPRDPHLGSEEDAAQPGLSAHLVAPVSTHTDATDGEVAHPHDVNSEKLVARYLPAGLLKRGTPWWITHKYNVRLVDVSEHVLATLEQPDTRWPRRDRAAQQDFTYRVLVGPGLPGTYLELALREPPSSWASNVPLVLVGGFLVLIVWATWLLRQQVRQVLQAEAAWRTEAAWRSAMEDSALVGLRARDAQGRLIYVNRTFCEMVGRSADELVGRSPPMPYWPSDALDEAEQRSQRNLAGLAPREGYEAHWVHADGRRVDVMVFESPLVDASGRHIGWMGSMIDITQRKQLEERERHQAEAMAHQARLTTLGEVASALAHQLNQPLTVIASYNSGVLRMLERAGFDNDTVLNALRRQGEQVAEAGRIVQRIRGFLTRRAPQRERCDLPATLHRAVKLLQRDWRHQPVRIDWALPDTLPDVLADPVLIEQVTLNLVRNAIDAGLGAQRQPVQLRIQARAEASLRHVCVCVEDNGPGLQARTIEELTAPFYSTKAEGMGMGLAICRSVIEAHRGKLDACASSELGGACFRFTLPIWSEP